MKNVVLVVLLFAFAEAVLSATLGPSKIVFLPNMAEVPKGSVYDFKAKVNGTLYEKTAMGVCSCHVNEKLRPGEPEKLCGISEIAFGGAESDVKMGSVIVVLDAHMKPTKGSVTVECKK